MRARGGVLRGALVALPLAAMILGAGDGRAETIAADSIVVNQALDDDLYALGGEVVIDAPVSGAVVLAAGNARIGGDAQDDVMVAAGRVELRGGVGDDLRAAGGNVRVTGFVTDQATIAGGTVTIGPGSAIGGRTWIAAGDAEIAGQIGGNLRVAAGTVVISGAVVGDVEVAAREIRIEPGAVIGGDLIWRSREPPLIAEDARILGEVRATSTGDEIRHSEGPAARFTGSIALGITVVVAALIVLWLAPQLVARSAAIFGAAPGRTLLLGAAAFVLTPVVVVVLFVTVLGWLLGLVVLAGYVFGLMLSGLVGLLIIVQLLRDQVLAAATGWRSVLLLVMAVAVLVAAQQVPVLGSLLSVLLLLAGFGALTALATGRGPARR